jgi:uncharacterized protein (DUF2147 family)
MRFSLPALFLLALVAAPAEAAQPIEGLWRNPIGSAIIRVAPCGGVLCGTVVWASARGRAEVAKNTSRVVGTTVLTNVKRAAPNRWTGRLFVPDDNIHVSAKLEFQSYRDLRLTGCGLVGLICRTQIWTRVDEPLPPSD